MHFLKIIYIYLKKRKKGGESGRKVDLKILHSNFDFLMVKLLWPFANIELSWQETLSVQYKGNEFHLRFNQQDC